MKNIVFEMNKIKYEIRWSANVTIEEKKTTELFSLLSASRQEKATKLLIESKRRESIWAGYLLEMLLREKGVQGPFLYQIGNGGKPKLAGNGSNVDMPKFSISHSKDCVCATVSEKNVGVDMERIHPAKVKQLSERFFCKDEIEWLKDDENQLEKFYDIWTFKEAVCKCKEIPLTEILSNVNYLECEEVVLDFIINESKSCCKSYQYEDCIVLQWQEDNAIMTFCGEI